MPALDGRALLSRERFKELCLARDGGRCVFCKRPAVDAHHIFDRKLFADGGYRLDNAASVCAECHWACETTRLSARQALAAAGIARPVLPPGFDEACEHDKWGNRLREDGSREPGPLMADDGARKALAAGGYLGLVYPI